VVFVPQSQTLRLRLLAERVVTLTLRLRLVPFARPAIMTQREGITRFGAAAVIAQAVPLRTVSAIVHASPSLRAVSLRATRAVKTRRLPLPARLLTRSAPAASLSP